MNDHSRWPYRELGPPNLPPLVCLHGFMGRGADWLPVAEPLAAHHRCLLPNLPGHGDNTRRALAAPLDFERLTHELAAWLDWVGLDRVDLLGYSLGGRLALYFAVRFPGRVGRLVLESANPGLQNPAARRERAALDDQRAAQLRQEGVDKFVQNWYRLPLFASLAGQPGLLAQVAAQRQHNDARWLAKVISDLSPGRQQPLWAALPGLSLPVLLLAGALDEKYVALAQTMAARLPRAQVAVVPQAGHNIHLEQPNAWCEQVTDFLLNTSD